MEDEVVASAHWAPGASESSIGAVKEERGRGRNRVLFHWKKKQADGTAESSGAPVCQRLPVCYCAAARYLYVGVGVGSTSSRIDPLG